MKYCSLKTNLLLSFNCLFFAILSFFSTRPWVALPEWHFNRTFQIQCNKEIKAHWQDRADFFWVKRIVLIMSFLPTLLNLPESTPTPNPKSANIQTRFFTPSYQQDLKSVRPPSRCIVPCIYTVWVSCPLPAHCWER